MDSIERMRRINDLTRELKQRGFAESSLEAIQQANQIYGHEYGLENIDDNLRHGIITSNQVDKIGKDVNMEEAYTINTDKKLSKIAESVETLTSKMNEIIKAINDLDLRLADLKKKQDTMALKSEQRVQVQSSTSNDYGKSEDVQTSRTTQSAHVEHAEEASQHSSSSKPKGEYDLNQRTGDFQSQDVAIDKMFYFGKGKK